MLKDRILIGILTLVFHTPLISVVSATKKTPAQRQGGTWMQSGTSPTYGTNKVKNFLRKTAHNLRENAYKARASTRSFFNMTTSSGRCVKDKHTWTLDSSSCTGSLACDPEEACCNIANNTVVPAPTNHSCSEWKGECDGSGCGNKTSPSHPCCTQQHLHVTIQLSAVLMPLPPQ